MLLHVEVAPSHKLTYFHAPDSKSGVDKFAPFFPHVVHLNPLKDCNCIRMSKHCNPVERAIRQHSNVSIGKNMSLSERPDINHLTLKIPPVYYEECSKI